MSAVPSGTGSRSADPEVYVTRGCACSRWATSRIRRDGSIPQTVASNAVAISSDHVPTPDPTSRTTGFPRVGM